MIVAFELTVGLFVLMHAIGNTFHKIALGLPEKKRWYLLVGLQHFPLILMATAAILITNKMPCRGIALIK